MYGIQPNRNGFVRCPFHNEKTPSMKVDKKVAHCFGCGWGGDVIKFVMDYERCDFKKAFYILGGSYENKSDREHELTRMRFDRERKEREEHERVEASFKRKLSRAITQCRLMITASDPFSDTYCFASNQLPFLVGVWEEKYINRQEVNEIDVLGILRQVGRKYDSFARGYG